MEVEMLNGGRLTAGAGIWRQGDELERPMRIPVPAYLIETDGERVLVDTGLNPAAAADTTSHYGKPELTSVFGFELDRPVAEQVDLDTITRVVLTHLHFDHAGGLALVPPSVPVYVQRREWEAGHDRAAIARNFYLPADYAFADDRLTLVDGRHDLLGDGSIVLLPTPGHTPGHQSVQVAERLVIGGDVAHFRATLDDGRFPSFADDFDAQARSASVLRRLRDSGLTVLPGHDPDVLVPGRVEL